jgi:hypothetical protein
VRVAVLVTVGVGVLRKFRQPVVPAKVAQILLISAHWFVGTA